MKQRKVKIRTNQVFVNNTKIPLISGEVHYWRLNPSYWKTILAEVRNMGIRIISTYVPWDYHEPKRGRFDFTGKTDPTRNLKGFLELTKSEGFWVIIRPGPYIYSEWPNEGVPTYAYKYHRLHSKFLKFAEVYIKKVTDIIKPFLASRKSGHIILLQADNEIDPWPDVFGHQYGLCDKPGLFQEFLSKKYKGDIYELNRAWQAEYQSFDHAGPFIACMMQGEHGLPLKGDPELRRNLDYFEFKYDYSLKVARWNVEAYRKIGIDVPIYLNLYPFFYAHDWEQLQSTCDMVGIDLYPSNELSEDEHEQRKFIDKIRFLNTISTVSYIAEFSSGIWHNRHYESGALTPNHYRLIALSALLGGIKGWNWYMLVNRDNWYMSPINEWGRKRTELFDVFKSLVHLFYEMKPYNLVKKTDIGVTCNPLQYAARTQLAGDRILSTLYGSDIDYEVFDPRRSVLNKKIIFYSGNQWLSRKAHENLKAYVKSGGVLVAFQDYPRKDDEFRPCDVIGFHDPDRVLFEFRRPLSISLRKGVEVKLTSLIYSFQNVSGQPIQSNFGNYGNHTIGYLKTVGKGKILHLGVEPTKELLLEILRFFHVPIYVNSSTKDVKTAIFNSGRKYYVVAVNNGREDKSAIIHFNIPNKVFEHFRVRNLLTNTSHRYPLHQHKASFSVDLSAKDGSVFEVSLS
ncbi:MAG: hypothetical protein A3G33_00290 [Omnitrophica bacterium RIFCSPLOWO2_12_FULL_44_17]|uniref:Uncharacterized protein n=1 Tax=Candidatus Danuiimicrobium aquiferis TaxID=1801832 RepID=A0A1G1KTX4_9BACT|nr:MAG: hypothetical protein A3B72_01310 [Omnitrophica bacterium RIFCSPHIGHO2_02_FULL_45_28]OGW92630.1 MAG: hypothetical protein A3E74_05440 [Omnitrophica bacterium RIFCSPHIGHO2_12_FULL_44_12]OGW96403.1 MAG: hypothetical protein A3G33_00290 [Omnitrophica bacterium RIFCSPLOWO2_12_FULL_44_17]OGX02142.1 MAG: hypothetical protein A3J12_03565 [Omnitrophica bacterium RIFCSPLOWO2_02_FULL_44_11]